jgi:hypothetical protein
MHYLKQSTAITIQLGPFVDKIDGVTAETGLTISQADVRLSKNGAAFAQANDANAATHDENGWYRKQLSATDTGTLGRLIVAVAEEGALPVWREFLVLPANVFDSLVAGSDYLQVDVSGAGAIAFTYTLTSAIDSSPIPAAEVWVTTDQGGSNVVASGTTDGDGQVVFYLDGGTYYLWRQKAGWNFDNPDTETVS